MAPPVSNSCQFRWQKSQKGVWERNLDECEKFYRLSAKKPSNCFPVTGCASFSTHLYSETAVDELNMRLTTALRRAWIMLRYEHPSLASRIEHGNDSDQWKRVYELFPEGGEELWLESTFKVVETNMDAPQWFNEEAPPFEMPTVFYVRSKRGEKFQRTVFLRCPHDLTDGVGILLLIDELFRHAANAYLHGAKFILPDWSIEHKVLSPCLRVAASIPETLSAAQASRLKEIQTQNGSVYNHSHLLGLPSSSAPASQDTGFHIQYLPVTISRANTDKILRNCKVIAPGISVTHIFMSALAQTLADLQPQKEEPYPARFIAHIMINLRPFCNPPYNTRTHAAAAYHAISAQALGLDLVVPGSCSQKSQHEKNGDDFSRMATQVRDFYQTIRPVLSDDIHEQVILAPHTFHSMTPLLGADTQVIPDPTFCPVSLSSIGNVGSIVSPSHGPFDLSRVWAASEPIGAGVAVFLSCWDGEIHLSGVFDTRYHADGYVRKFLDGILRCVYKGLDIDEQAALKQAEPVEARLDKKRKREDEEVEDRAEQNSSQRRVKIQARPPLREKPALGNARMHQQDKEKVVRGEVDEAQVIANDVNDQTCEEVI